MRSTCASGRSGVGSPVFNRERRFAVPSSQNDALSHGIAMVVAPLCMGLFGYWLDGVLGTGWIFAALFTTFGIAGSIGLESGLASRQLCGRSG